MQMRRRGALLMQKGIYQTTPGCESPRVHIIKPANRTPNYANSLTNGIKIVVQVIKKTLKSHHCTGKTQKSINRPGNPKNQPQFSRGLISTNPSHGLGFLKILGGIFQ